MRGRLLKCALCLALALQHAPPVSANAEPSPRDPWRLILGADNDNVTGRDQHYTSGLAIGLVSGRGRLARWLRPVLRIIPPFDRDGEQARFGIRVAQEIYTPENPRSAGLTSKDRPHAGWLYAGLAVYDEATRVLRSGTRIGRLDLLELDLGVIGPVSGGEQVQGLVHGATSNSSFVGWESQLQNEFGFIFRFERRWRIPSNIDTGLGLDIDLVPFLGFDLGNVSTGVLGGGQFRIGVNLPMDYGKGHINGIGRYAKRGAFSMHAYAGASADIVIRNIFLDGNTFESSHSVAKNALVGRFPIGLVVQWRRTRLAFSVTWVTREFERQIDPDAYGTLTLSVDF